MGPIVDGGGTGECDNGISDAGPSGRQEMGVSQGLGLHAAEICNRVSPASYRRRRHWGDHRRIPISRS